MYLSNVKSASSRLSGRKYSNISNYVFSKNMKNLNFLDLNSVLVCATGYIKQAELTTLKHQR